ncbi:polysaccharide deacetylase family protein [Pararhodobacter zhoushanensis]|uniref:Chitooligosaccharide deacetylase n=1 Tax=Pararhodobacter zhoushanensis TaxID=2479545 RepID=A0ABT3GTK4_9RHOB|nr:polysaccharide deacetylase family protein [Pararhodobacter zhoushanensis]MCW1930869.1 polysaccharide deacetylase family protein [Pararhodobacter zhoushanensis]
MTIIHRRTLLSGLGALGFAASAQLGTVTSAVAQTVPAVPTTPMPRLRRTHELVSLTSVHTDRPRVALTFDDGPHPQNTPHLLDILARYRVKATFYVIGQNARRYPEIVRRIVAEGHELGNHTWTHPVLSRQSDSTILTEIDRTQQMIWDTVGAVPVTMRPPYGSFTHRQMQMLFDQRNLSSVVWSVDPEDWRRPGVSVVAQRMIQGARPGAVILAHDIHGPTIRAVPAALDGILARGLQPVTMSELLAWPHWGPRGLRYVGRATTPYQG